jgi:putative transposase
MDGKTWYSPQACQFLNLQHHLHSSFGKSNFIERKTRYITDKNKEGFDDYLPYKRKKMQTITCDQLVKIICGFS